MFGLFGGATRREDKQVAEMLMVTLASYKKTFQTVGWEFMTGTMKGYPGVVVMQDEKTHLMFRFRNELSPFVFNAMSVGEPGSITAVGEPPYDGFSITVGLKNDAFLVGRGNRRRQASKRGKYLANWFIARGANLIP